MNKIKIIILLSVFSVIYKIFIKLINFINNITVTLFSIFNLNISLQNVFLIGGIFLTYIAVLIQVAFFTLLERKIMGAIQRRVGPNVLGLGGFLQPFADGLKLASKETIIPLHSNNFLFFFAPILTFFLSLISWCILPLHQAGAFCNPDTGLLLIIMLSSLNVYGLLLGGWASNNNYAILGAIRSAAQMLSYELLFSLAICPVIMITSSINLHTIGRIVSSDIFLIFKLAPISILFFIVILAETNRAPFDLPEAEAELVAGYNVEYSSFIFALYFLGEYSNIMIMSCLFILLFGNGWGFFLIPATSSILINALFFFIKYCFLLFLFVWVRATYPRLKVEQLMSISWTVFLNVLLYFTLLFSFILFFFY